MLCWHEASPAGRALDAASEGRCLSVGDTIVLNDLVRANLPTSLSDLQARAVAVVEQGQGHSLTKGDVRVLLDLILHPDLPPRFRERPMTFVEA